jgi:YVTN family beta-propeller protein
VVDPSADAVYVANSNSNAVSVIDVPRNVVTATIDVGAGTVSVITPEGVAFNPYWQDVQSYPTGCSGTVSPGFSVSGSYDCGESSTTDDVNYIYLPGGSSFTYAIVVPAGSEDRVTYAIPAGGYLNNGAGTVTLDGNADGTTAGGAAFGSTCTQPKKCVQWKSVALDPGPHVLTIKSQSDYVNLYGMRVKQKQL